MATKERAGREVVARPSIPPTVEGGTDYLESLGSFIDNLFGDRRMRRHASETIAATFDRDDDPDDPSPSPVPPPVPDGSEVLTKGDPSERETR